MIYVLDDTGYKRNLILLFLFVFVPVHYVSMYVFYVLIRIKKKGIRIEIGNRLDTTISMKNPLSEL